MLSAVSSMDASASLTHLPRRDGRTSAPPGCTSASSCRACRRCGGRARARGGHERVRGCGDRARTRGEASGARARGREASARRARRRDPALQRAVGRCAVGIWRAPDFVGLALGLRALDESVRVRREHGAGDQRRDVLDLRGGSRGDARAEALGGISLRRARGSFFSEGTMRARA